MVLMSPCGCMPVQEMERRKYETEEEKVALVPELRGVSRQEYLKKREAQKLAEMKDALEDEERLFAVRGALRVSLGCLGILPHGCGLVTRCRSWPRLRTRWRTRSACSRCAGSVGFFWRKGFPSLVWVRRYDEAQRAGHDGGRAGRRGVPFRSEGLPVQACMPSPP